MLWGQKKNSKKTKTKKGQEAEANIAPSARPIPAPLHAQVCVHARAKCQTKRRTAARAAEVMEMATKSSWNTRDPSKLQNPVASMATATSACIAANTQRKKKLVKAFTWGLAWRIASLQQTQTQTPTGIHPRTHTHTHSLAFMGCGMGSLHTRCKVQEQRQSSARASGPIHRGC